MKYCKRFFYDIYVDVCLVLIGFGYAIYDHKENIWTILGTLLVIFSTAIWITARVQLGNSFAVEPKIRPLVNRGLYSKFRHPIYLFSSLAVLGILMMLQNGYLFFPWIILLIAQGARIKAENRLLEKAYGDDYVAYVKKIWF